MVIERETASRPRQSVEQCCSPLFHHGLEPQSRSHRRTPCYGECVVSSEGMLLLSLPFRATARTFEKRKLNTLHQVKSMQQFHPETAGFQQRHRTRRVPRSLREILVPNGM